ncbi:MAG: HU family DNA-binding protein [Alloprevotella sp.]|nr:HU family DNA-binding protein [Alloprevotella sp.]MBR1652780.1 HU family DNA-binding protein [Alloprevotella sp.]
MFRYIIRAIKSPKDKSVKYYAQAAKQDPVDLEKLADRIEKRSTVSTADVKAVLSALEYEIMQCLVEGQTVRLGDVGTFYTSLKSRGVATQREAWKKGAQLITHVTMCFRRSNDLTEALKPSKVSFGMDSAEQERYKAYREAHPEEFE